MSRTPLIQIWRSLLPLFVLAAPVAAHATSITFDTLSAGTTLETQYAGSGVTFIKYAPDTGNAVNLPRVVTYAAALSAPNAVAIDSLTGGEFKENVCAASFAATHRSISMYVGDAASGSSTVTLTVYRANGSPITSRSVSVTGGAGTPTWMSITTSEDFRYFVVSGNLNRKVRFDNLTFDTNTATSPDFTLSWPSGFPVQLSPGSSATTTVTVHRIGGSTGPIYLSMSGLPTGVTYSLSPAAATGTDGEVITVTFYAAAGSPPVSAASVQLVGTPTTSAGASTHSANILLTVRGTYDAQITGIEVTQGVQSIDLPRRSASSPSAPVSFQGGSVDAAGNPLLDRGVDLVAGGKTVVRVFANLRRPPTLGTLGKFLVRLNVCTNDLSSCFDTLMPELGELPLTTGSDFVTDADRIAPNLAFTYVLPPAYTTGTIALQAVLSPADGLSAESDPCSDALCTANDIFALKDITFTATRDQTIAPIELTINYAPLADPKSAFVAARNLTPTATGGVEVLGWMGQLEVNDIANRDESIEDRMADINDALYDFADDRRLVAHDNWFVFGLLPDDAYTLARVDRGQTSDCDFPDIFDCNHVAFGHAWTAAEVAASTAPLTVYRPITEITHEFFHLLGRSHASAACGADNNHNATDDWPPDQQGFIQAFGLDRTGGAWLAASGAPGPYTLFDDDRAGDPTKQMFDLMGYCSNLSIGFETSHWNSARGWHENVEALSAGASSGPTPGSSADYLMVGAVLRSDGTVHLSHVNPMPNMSLASNSSYWLVTFNGAGAMLNAVHMAQSRAADDSGSGGAPSVLLHGQLPRAGAEYVAIYTNDGTLLDWRQRNPTLPTIGIIDPAPGLLVDSQPTVHVSWSVGGAPPNSKIKVDYSSDSVPGWKPLYRGPLTSDISVRRDLLSGARQCGRIRVRLNDGFNEVEAISGCIVVVPRAPRVTIEEMQPCHGFRGESVAYFSGYARDDQGAPITDPAKLGWDVGGYYPFGQGRAAGLWGFPAGDWPITLTATDSQGQTGSTTITVRCVALPNQNPNQQQPSTWCAALPPNVSPNDTGFGSCPNMQVPAQ